MALFVKTPQRESNVFKKSQNLLTVDIDDQGSTDFSASYLDMEIMFKSGAAGNPYLTGLVNLGNPLTGASYSGAAMLKNVRLESDQQGLVEELRFCNRHTQTMRKFLMTEQQNASSTIRGENTVKLDPNTNRGHIHIPLSDILGCGAGVWPNAKMGMSRLKMELEDVVPWSYSEVLNGVEIAAASQSFATIPAASLPTAAITTVNKFTSLAQAQYYFQTGKTYAIALTGATTPVAGAITITSLTCAGTPSVPAVAVITIGTTITAPANTDITNISLSITQANGGGIACTDVAISANPSSVVTVVGGVAQNLLTPWLVGHYYTIGYTTGAGANVTNYVWSGRLLSKAANAATAANLDLTFDRAYLLANPVALTNVFVNVPAITAVSDFEVYSCNLVSAKLIAPTSATAQFAFKTYLLEMVNMQPTTDFRRQVMVDDTCDQVKLLMPFDTSLLSTRDTVTSYRNSIQNNDTTTQDVSIDNLVNGSLYYDRLIANLDGVQSIQPMNGSEEVIVIAERLSSPQPGINNVVEFRIAASANLQAKSAYFYKRIAKQF